jgi:hypothetical protein
MSLIVYWNSVSWSKRLNDLANVPARRYVDLAPWRAVRNYDYYFFRIGLEQFDSIFTKTLYLLVILQSFGLIRRLNVKNAFLISGCILSTVVGGFSIFMPGTLRWYFITGMNPYFLYVPIFFLVLQIVIWIYLNMFLFKKIAEKKSV